MNLCLHVIPAIGPCQLQKLGVGELENLYSELLRIGRSNGSGGSSATTVRYIHRIINKALYDAVRRNLLVRNPADLVQLPRQARNASEMKTWTARHLREFLAVVRDDRLRAAWTLIATTGLRRGEALGLRWEDVDLNGGRMAVRQTLVHIANKVRFSEPKTKAGQRSVALDQGTVVALRDHRRRQLEERLARGPARSDTGLVFTREDGQFIHPGGFSKMFDRLVTKARLPRIPLHGCDIRVLPSCSRLEFTRKWFKNDWAIRQSQ